MAYDAVKKAPKPAHAPSIVQGFDVHSPVRIYITNTLRPPCAYMLAALCARTHTHPHARARARTRPHAHVYYITYTMLGCLQSLLL